MTTATVAPVGARGEQRSGAVLVGGTIRPLASDVTHASAHRPTTRNGEIA